jgi:hypothetical protein
MSQIDELLRDFDLPEGVADLVSGLAGGGLSIGLILLGFMMRLILYGVFAMVGGIIGAAVFQKTTAVT